MILKEKYSLGNDKQYYCKFTEELDQCAGFDLGEYPYYKHYLLDIGIKIDFIIIQFVFLVVQLVEFG